MKDNILLTKSYAFGLRILKLSDLLEDQRRYVLAKQVLRSGTSVGANAEELVAASSLKDFLHRASICYREARETQYWLRLMRDGRYIEHRLADSLIADCDELVRILSSITKTTRERLGESELPSEF